VFLTRKIIFLYQLQQVIFEKYNTHYVLILFCIGCGKSNIALVAILSSLEQYQSNSNIFQCPKPENFRVVYIAPMKSLVSEITRKYSKALSPLGIKVQELTSDVHISREELSEVHIVVTVCEKFDILTRKVGYRGVSSENSLMSSVSHSAVIILKIWYFAS
jgi:replicative superfamily II helicase